MTRSPVQSLSDLRQDLSKALRDQERHERLGNDIRVAEYEKDILMLEHEIDHLERQVNA